MAKVRGSAVRWVSDEFPGWVEVTVSDAAGRLHRIIEKVPVVSAEPLVTASTLPVEIWLDAEVAVLDGDRARVTLAHQIVSTEGLRQLLVSVDDVDWS